ncbi:hypothetical protein [Brevibacillus sp. FIR094]|uniref:hypothetical protein n=1 Tax=Brevibacillus sp. FIR094 TaxID=3134809 RepID=UPI003D1F49A0
MRVRVTEHKRVASTIGHSWSDGEQFFYVFRMMITRVVVNFSSDFMSQGTAIIVFPIIFKWL